MLKAVTKRFADKSTIKKFEFEFYCDCCGKPIKTEVHEFVTGFRNKVFLNSDEREARAIIYASDHGKAYERANNEARLELNKCEICGDMVCEDCTVYGAKLDGGVCCKACAGKQN
ncbi:MAG: hypothetical protein IKM66_05595 [Clostridia bacterium]|nr:hypothetical protein [Clostridia bacterium]